MWFLTGCSCNSLSCPYGASSSRIYLVHTRERWGLRLMFLYWNDFQGFEHSMLFYCFQNASHLDLFPLFLQVYEQKPRTQTLFPETAILQLACFFLSCSHSFVVDFLSGKIWSRWGSSRRAFLELEGEWGLLRLVEAVGVWKLLVVPTVYWFAVGICRSKLFWNNSTRWWFPNILLNFHPLKWWEMIPICEDHIFFTWGWFNPHFGPLCKQLVLTPLPQRMNARCFWPGLRNATLRVSPWVSGQSGQGTRYLKHVQIMIWLRWDGKGLAQWASQFLLGRGHREVMKLLETNGSETSLPAFPYGLQDTLSSRTCCIALHLHCSVQRGYVWSFFTRQFHRTTICAIRFLLDHFLPGGLAVQHLHQGWDVLAFSIWSWRLKPPIPKDGQSSPADFLPHLHAVFDPDFSSNEALAIRLNSCRKDVPCCRFQLISPLNFFPEFSRYDVHVTSGGLALTHSMDFISNLAFKAQASHCWHCIRCGHFGQILCWRFVKACLAVPFVEEMRVLTDWTITRSYQLGFFMHIEQKTSSINFQTKICLR